MKNLIGGALAVLFLQGCATMAPPDYSKLEADLDPLLQSPARGQIHQTLELSEQERFERVDDLLFEPLTPGNAQHLALVNSPHIRAHLHRLGVVEAEQVQAQMLSNPTLAVSAMRPEGGGRWELGLGLSQSVLDLMTRSLRKTLAEEALTSARLDLLDTLNQELYQVQQDYFHAVGASHREAVARLALNAAETAALLAERLHEAGNLKELTLLHYRDQQLQSQRALRRAQADAQQAQTTLALRLGLEHPAMMELPTTLPQLPDDEQVDVASLTDHALTQRLDLRIARQLQEVAGHRESFYARQGRFTQWDIGVDVERGSDGVYSAGPTMAVGLPLFDRNQARRAGAGAQLLRADALVDARTLELRTQLPDLANRLRLTRDNVEQLEQQVIPQWQQQVDLNLREYNFMLSGAFELLNAKAREFEAWREHAQTLEQYWIQRILLAMVSATPLDAALPDAVQLPSVEAGGQGHEHHNH
ncbi:TolC family protein [Marinobacter sp.]|uniref:TolC family protein n=1 Tax=Marinobacter sp. TaxID=50741 RepID=UPI001A0C95C4|nr:TolC family protein [Marinobacter sp.]MBE0486057.1 TolC family protein [Marinobacter sp.]